MLNLAGNLFLQIGHLQNTKEIAIKINNKETPIIAKKVIPVNVEVMLKNIDRNKQTREKFLNLSI